MNLHGKVIWFFGLPCSGKTTLARELMFRLMFYHQTECKMLDGDIQREHINMGFSKENRITNIKIAAYAAKILDPRCVIASYVTPYKEMRDILVEKLDIIFIYVDCPVKVCEERDVKGMYKLARQGKIPNFTGVDDVFEATSPLEYDVRVNTNTNSVEECVDYILDSLSELK